MFATLLSFLVLTSGFGAILGQDGVKTRPINGVKGAPMVMNKTIVEDPPGGATLMGDLHRANESQSALDKFLNTTKVPTGICFKEVPTVSLVKSGEIPAGNGSDPSLSRVQVCCEGYERNVHNFRKCDPVCEEPCFNGLCVGPNKCTCYPDFVNNLQGKCVPTCPIGCDNGECNLQTKVCDCKEGFELDKGRQFCVPKCTGGCGAGRCVAVEKCECDQGYEIDEDGKCVPKCQQGCVNGECIAPEVCQCRPGYERTDDECEPVCSNGCFNGICTAPETCTCKPGYKMGPAGNKCEHSCDRPCMNGDCTGPNVCTCHRGYILDELKPYKCLPHCPNGCPNGVCSGPNMCLCNAGYIKDRSLKGSQACVKRKLEYVRKNNKNVVVARNKCCKGYVRQKHKCVPVCSQPCENSKCTGPNFCTCNEGFTRLSNSRCIPHCDNCDNGFCNKPGHCQCNSGYVSGANGSCVAECKNCTNGYCLEPNVCLCREGFAPVGTEENRLCEPVCEDGCPNGKCSAPGECICDEEFVKNDFGKCVSKEPPTTTPEPCQQGYEEFNSTCVPVCNEQCENGECVAPNQCGCFEGYSNANSTANHLCRPVCSNGCLNGNCVAPGKCICDKGYGKIADDCIPLCEKCSFGHCIQPEVCVCDRGYELVDGDCVPICEEECKNAKCTGPNSCTCLPGYNYTDINSLFECLPVCDDDCDNGVCVAPNTCECNPGFVKDEDSCVDPIELCRSTCHDGFCDANATCNCNRGFIMNLNGSCERTCPDGCVHGECIAGVCLCNKNYRPSLVNSSVCEPICEDEYEYENGCLNGKCVEPNVCQCDDGYDFVDGSHTRCQSIEEIRIEKQRKLMEKLCSQECSNGKCVQGYCLCTEGYGNPEGQIHRCIALCDPPCRNGTCILPNRCECDQGYQFYNDSLSVCLHGDDIRRIKARLEQEYCEENCQNGNCVEGKCSCSVGFRPSTNDEFYCQPYCEKPCLNGVCAGNNRCRCFEGYQNTVDGSQCDPVCENECVNAKCVGPNECECDSGYVFQQNSVYQCEKVLSKSEIAKNKKQELCKAKCENGICIEGICKCAEGYSNADNMKITCMPHCSEGCPNGQCIAPDECVCDTGYEISEEHGCKPICEQDCINGFCGAPGRCDCFPGYKPTLDANECAADCGEEGCINGYCAAPGVCECFAGYQQNEEDETTCQLIPDIIYKVDSQSNSLIYNAAYVKYAIPLVVITILVTSAIITMIILRNKRKDYHIGKLETKENCVYFMPHSVDTAKDEEDKFSV
ncbi:fibrillin-1-like [Toxorhynchites rutilus septentrionalis]|uniref:fibrillin-1-like n=1 Tax=Toxorhynchites rutilus septentrionalis TaxID=329112 RepID=UPI00247A6166|nr:fibrillin-1-like [Toxorhynchites rutilus septentrionalis]